MEPKVATTASEVLSRALEFWGPEMERWVVGTTWDGAKACMYGGLQIGSGQRDPSQRNGLVPYWSTITSSQPYKKAEKYLLDELEAQGWPRDIVGFNDDRSRYESYEMYSRPGGRHYDGGVKRRERIKGVVCGALKRALADEPAADASEEVRGGEGEQTNQRI